MAGGVWTVVSQREGWQGLKGLETLGPGVLTLFALAFMCIGPQSLVSLVPIPFLSFLLPFIGSGLFVSHSSCTFVLSA